MHASRDADCHLYKNKNSEPATFNASSEFSNLL